MHTTRTTRILVLLLIVLAIGFNGWAARSVSPSGDIIGLDKKGNPIYRVRANGVKVGYKLIGSGEPLVMLGGLGGTMDDWPNEIIEALSKEYNLIIPDNRGMGHTTADESTFTYKLFADDVIGLLNALKVKRTHVLGYSMGGSIIQQLLVEYPERFDKAIICASSSDGSNVARVLNGKPTNVSPIIQRQIEATTHWKAPTEKLRSVKNQVMLIVGTSDTTVGVESSKTLALTIPGAWLVQFKKGTHRLINEVPQEFVRIVLTFLVIKETVGKK